MCLLTAHHMASTSSSTSYSQPFLPSPHLSPLGIRFRRWVHSYFVMSLLCISIVPCIITIMTVHCVHVFVYLSMHRPIISQHISHGVHVCVSYHVMLCTFVIYCMYRLETGSSDKQSLLVHSDRVSVASKYIRRIMTQLNMRYVHFKCRFHHHCSLLLLCWLYMYMDFQSIIMFVSQNARCAL